MKRYTFDEITKWLDANLADVEAITMTQEQIDMAISGIENEKK